MSKHLVGNVEISGAALDVLYKLFWYGATGAGDLPSKVGIGELIALGWAVKDHEIGSYLTEAGFDAAREFYRNEFCNNQKEAVGAALLRLELQTQKDKYNRDVYGLNNEGDPIGGEPAGGYKNDLERMTKDRDFFKLRVQTEAQHRELCKSNGVPDWYSHNWPQVFFVNGRWYGSQLGFKPVTGTDFKGFDTVNLLREQGSFICEGYFDARHLLPGQTSGNYEVFIRPDEYWPKLTAGDNDSAWANGALCTARNLTYNGSPQEGDAKFTLLEMANRILEHRVDRVHKKKDGYLMLTVTGRCRYMTWKERLAYVWFGAVPTYLDGGGK